MVSISKDCEYLLVPNEWQNLVKLVAVCPFLFLINLQVMHTLSENLAVNLRDSLRDLENLRDSLLECHRTEKGNRSLL